MAKLSQEIEAWHRLSVRSSLIAPGTANNSNLRADTRILMRNSVPDVKFFVPLQLVQCVKIVLARMRNYITPKAFFQL